MTEDEIRQAELDILNSEDEDNDSENENELEDKSIFRHCVDSKIYDKEKIKKLISKGYSLYDEILQNLVPWSADIESDDDSHLPCSSDKDSVCMYYLNRIERTGKDDKFSAREKYLERMDFDICYPDIVTAMYVPRQSQSLRDAIFYMTFKGIVIYSNDSEYIKNEKEIEDTLDKLSEYGLDNITQKNVSHNDLESLLKMSKNIDMNIVSNYTFGAEVINIGGEDYYRHTVATPFFSYMTAGGRFTIEPKDTHTIMYMECISLGYDFGEKLYNNNFIVSIQNKLYSRSGCIVIVDDGDTSHKLGNDITTEQEYKKKYMFEDIEIESEGNKRLNRKISDEFYRISEPKNYDPYDTD